MTFVFVDYVYSVKSDNSKLHLHQSRQFSSIFISVESWLHQFEEHIYLKNNMNIFNYKSIILFIIIIIIICLPMQSNMGSLLFVLVYAYHEHYYPVFNEKKYWWMLYVCTHYSPLWVAPSPYPSLAGPMSYILTIY